MKTKSLSVFILIVSLLGLSESSGQSFTNGTIGLGLDNLGRVRLYTPDENGIRQIDRISFLFAESAGKVYDYKHDAEPLTTASLIIPPSACNYELRGNTKSKSAANSPDIRVTHNVFGVTGYPYAYLVFLIENKKSQSVNGYAGIEIYPQPGGIYGNEIVKVSSSGTMTIFSPGHCVAFRILNHLTGSGRAIDYRPELSDSVYFNLLSSGLKTNEFIAGPDGSISLLCASHLKIDANSSQRLAMAVGYGTSEAAASNAVDIAVSNYYKVLPVELTSFTAAATENHVDLAWNTASENNNYGFEIQRKSSGSDFKILAFKPGAGNSAEPQSYFFRDDRINTDAGKVTYRLKQIDLNGTFTYSHEIEVDAIPSYIALSQNYPNPFNPVTTINYSTGTTGNVKLQIFDPLGNLVAEPVNETQSTGSYQINFNGTALPSGTYFYKLTAGGSSVVKKMTLIK